MWSLEQGISGLKEKDFKVTSQRTAILKFLAGRKDHPSADAVFAHVKKSFPSMSVATVYSTAQVLASAGLLKIISIDERRVYFDPDVAPHGHFLCARCGMVEDVAMPDSDILSHASLSSGRRIDRADIFFYGACSPCCSA